MSHFQQFGSQILDKCVTEIKKEENMDKIKQNILDPGIDYVFDRLWPYIMFTTVIFLLIFVLLLAIFFMIFRSMST